MLFWFLSTICRACRIPFSVTSNTTYHCDLMFSNPKSNKSELVDIISCKGSNNLCCTIRKFNSIALQSCHGIWRNIRKIKQFDFVNNLLFECDRKPIIQVVPC